MTVVGWRLNGHSPHSCRERPITHAADTYYRRTPDPGPGVASSAAFRVQRPLILYLTISVEMGHLQGNCNSPQLTSESDEIGASPAITSAFFAVDSTLDPRGGHAESRPQESQCYYVSLGSSPLADTRLGRPFEVLPSTFVRRNKQ